MIYFVSPRGCGIQGYLDGRWRKYRRPEIRCVTYDEIFPWPRLPSGTWIFSGIDQIPEIGQRLADEICQALVDTGQQVLNRPRYMLSRHALLEKLHAAGINEFRSYLPDGIDESVRYPVFVREAAEHTGSLSGLLADRRQLQSFLLWQRLRGYKPHELLVVEFCETADTRGEYRKYSAQYVAGQVSARYVHVDRYWMVKAHGSAFEDAWADEEFEFIRKNVHARRIKKIFEFARIDFGRIDYGMLNGNIQVWEINTNPTIGRLPPSENRPPKPERVKRLQQPGRNLFFDRFQSMLESIDTPHDPNISAESTITPESLQAWRSAARAARQLTRRRQLLGRLTTWPAMRQARDLGKKLLRVAPE